jgi:hypothetical protein
VWLRLRCLLQTVLCSLVHASILTLLTIRALLLYSLGGNGWGRCCGACCRYSLYLLCWYTSTNADTCGRLLQTGPPPLRTHCAKVAECLVGATEDHDDDEEEVVRC